MKIIDTLTANLVDFWQGPFGTDYHERNRPTVEQTIPVLKEMLDGVTPGSVLEPGCGLGVNLLALQALGWWPVEGVEPNWSACEQARWAGVPTHHADFLTAVRRLSGPYDLVLTSGLLIHVPPALIRETVEQIARICEEHVLVIEYASAVEEEREYRGHRDVLWTRPYGTLFEAWGGMKVLRHEQADPLLQPGCEWWLLQK